MGALSNGSLADGRRRQQDAPPARINQVSASSCAVLLLCGSPDAKRRADYFTSRARSLGFGSALPSTNFKTCRRHRHGGAGCFFTSDSSEGPRPASEGRPFGRRAGRPRGRRRRRWPTSALPANPPAAAPPSSSAEPDPPLVPQPSVGVADAPGCRNPPAPVEWGWVHTQQVHTLEETGVSLPPRTSGSAKRSAPSSFLPQLLRVELGDPGVAAPRPPGSGGWRGRPRARKRRSRISAK